MGKKNTVRRAVQYVRRVWLRKPITQIRPSGKLYRRVKEKRNVRKKLQTEE